MQAVNNEIPQIKEAEAVDEVVTLPLVEPPYLPPLSPEEAKKTYTLVLDLDETLVHYFEVCIYKDKEVID